MKTRIPLNAVVGVVGVVAVLALAACPKPVPDKQPPPPDPFCDNTPECPTGHICSAGTCVIGTCDPNLESVCDAATATDEEKPFCCKAWEICGGIDFQCKNDPNVHGIGCDQNDPGCTPCEANDDCAPGQFCSGAACFDAGGRKLHVVIPVLHRRALRPQQLPLCAGSRRLPVLRLVLGAVLRRRPGLLHRVGLLHRHPRARV